MDRERQEDVTRIGVLGGLPVPAIRVSRYSLYPGASNAGSRCCCCSFHQGSHSPTMYAPNDHPPTSQGSSSSRYPTSVPSRVRLRDRSQSPVEDDSNANSTAQNQTKRNSKACENCRTRRVKCQGGQPCIACVEVGLRDRCAVRAKARPNR